MTLIEQLREMLTMAEEAPEAIAEEAEVDSRVLRKFLNEEVDIPFSVADRLAGYLGVQLTRANGKWIRTKSKRSTDAPRGRKPRILKYPRIAGTGRD